MNDLIVTDSIFLYQIDWTFRLKHLYLTFWFELLTAKIYSWTEIKFIFYFSQNVSFLNFCFFGFIFLFEIRTKIKTFQLTRFSSKIAFSFMANSICHRLPKALKPLRIVLITNFHFSWNNRVSWNIQTLKWNWHPLNTKAKKHAKTPKNVLLIPFKRNLMFHWHRPMLLYAMRE